MALWLIFALCMYKTAAHQVTQKLQQLEVQEKQRPHSSPEGTPVGKALRAQLWGAEEQLYVRNLRLVVSTAQTGANQLLVAFLSVAVAGVSRRFPSISWSADALFLPSYALAVSCCFHTLLIRWAGSKRKLCGVDTFRREREVPAT